MLGLLCFAFVAIATNKHRTKLIAGSAVALVMVAALAPKSSWDRLLGVASADTQNLNQMNDQGSARQRFEIWRVARAITEDHPLFGVGTGAYKQVHRLYVLRQVRKFDPFAGGERDPHSTYLSASAETGIPGAMLFFAVFVSAVAMARRTQKQIATISPQRASYLRFLTTGLVAFGVAGVFGSYTHISFGLLFAALMWCTARAYLDDATRLNLVPR
jgi:O-antigen ligase